MKGLASQWTAWRPTSQDRWRGTITREGPLIDIEFFDNPRAFRPVKGLEP